MPWQPAHQNHAIERVSLTFQFKEEIPTRHWRDLLEAVTTRMPGLGFATRLDLNFTQSVLGQAPSPVAMSGRQVGGVVGMAVRPAMVGSGRLFQSNEGPEVREQISLQRNQVTYSATQYQRWSALRNRMIDSLGDAIDRALSLVDMDFVMLEYWDRFIFDGPISDVNYQELIRVDSRYLPSFASGRKGLWHSHVGYLDSLSLGSNRLINLNVDVFDQAMPNSQEAQRSVGIHSMSQDRVEPKSSPTTLVHAASTLDDLHTLLKVVLGDVISSEMAERISLNGEV
jgi:uncharacterized protein (TIGR04255 family)